MFHKCMDVYLKDTKIFLCRCFRFQPFPEALPLKTFSRKGFVVVDEQSPSGNLSSCIFEGFSEQKKFPKNKMFARKIFL